MADNVHDHIVLNNKIGGVLLDSVFTRPCKRNSVIVSESKFGKLNEGF